MQSAIIRSTLRASNKRSFSNIPSMMGAGDVGSPKARGFMAEKDPFIRREAANEGMYIRELEKEKIELLRKKLKVTKKHNEELDKHLEELLGEQGGEKG
ncbi:ATPase inhibitor [Penicillium sp. IBT 16267x]|nr:ATPase inhibitor [Penicillium sp. IBT 16267x]